MTAFQTTPALPESPAVPIHHISQARAVQLHAQAVEMLTARNAGKVLPVRMWSQLANICAGIEADQSAPVAAAEPNLLPALELAWQWLRAADMAGKIGGGEFDRDAAVIEAALKQAGAQ